MWDEVHNKGLENSETKRLTTISPTLGYHMLPPEVIEVPSSSNPFIHHLQASSMRKGFDQRARWEVGTSMTRRERLQLLILILHIFWLKPDRPLDESKIRTGELSFSTEG